MKSCLSGSDAFRVHNNGVLEASLCLFALKSARENPHIIVSGKGEASLSLWDISASESRFVDSLEYCEGNEGFVKARVTADKKLMFCLDGNGQLSAWDRKAMFKLFHLDRVVIDFVLLDKVSEDEDAIEHLLFGQTAKLVTLTQHSRKSTLSNGHSQVTTLEIFSVPEFNFIFSTEVSLICKLLECNNSLTDIYLVEGHYISKSGDEKEKRISLRTVTEKLPMERFYYLLHQKRFSEALKFSEQFKLESELVYRIKVGHLLDSYVVGESTLDEIISCLSNIVDVKYAVEFCLNASLKTYEDTLRLLQYAKSIVTVGEKSNSTEDCEEEHIIVCEVARAMNRLGTYRMAFTGTFDSESWQLFRVGDVVKHLCVCLSESNIRSALILWKRHHIEDNLIANIKNIVSAIPENLNSRFYLDWLSDDVMPSIHCPEDRLFMNLWSEERAKLMEITESSEWPSNALKLLNTTSLCGDSALSLNTCFTPKETRTYIVDCFDAVNCTRDSTFDNEIPISKYRLALEDLCFLHDVLKFYIGSADYCNENPTTIAFQLLDRVTATELLEDCVSNEIRPYLKRHSTDIDGVLLEYIVELMDSVISVSTAMSDAPWETRVISLIEFIESTEHKVDAVLEITKRVNIPWSSGVDELMKESLSWKHSRGTELAAQFKLLKVRKLLSSYGLRECNVSDKMHIVKAAKYILSKCDCDKAMDDCLFIASTHSGISERDCFSLRLQYLCNAGKTQDVVALLKGLADEDLVAIRSGVCIVDK